MNQGYRITLLLAAWIAAAVLLSFLLSSFTDTIVTVMVYAVLVAASAWMISRKPWISRNHADRMYYAISMAGVVLFFAYNAPKRADLGYRDTIANIEADLSRKKRQQDVRHAEREVFNDIRMMPESELVALVKDAVTTGKRHLQETIAATCKPATVISLPAMEGESRYPIGKNLERARAQVCDHWYEELDDPGWNALAAIESLADLDPYRAFLGGAGRNIALTVSSYQLPLTSIADMRKDPAYIDNMDKAIAALSQEAEKLNERLDAVRTAYDAWTNSPLRSPSVRLALWVDAYWPFILISLLGLKLARHLPQAAVNG